MKQHSKSPFLVHWTGRDIDDDQDLAEDLSTAKRERYADRLVGTLRTGLWLTKGDDPIYTAKDMLYSTTPRVCFTEVLLSRVTTHSARYGRMGLGFTRDFILKQNGSPVIYFNDRTDEIVMNSLMAVTKRLGAIQSMLESATSPRAQFAQVEALEAYDIMNHLFAFAKPMSDATDVNDFVFYEEAEWRVCWHLNAFAVASAGVPSMYEFRRTAQRRQESWLPPPGLIPSGTEVPAYYLRFGPEDLALLVLPDDLVRDTIWGHAEFGEWREQRAKPLPMLTLQECIGF